MKKAFTLIELLVVLALVSLLVSLVGPSGKRMYEKFSKRLEKIKEVGIEHDKEFDRFLADKPYFDLNSSEDKNITKEKK
ncbi:MAG: prepilin-type N-terminal cleavage/methylation domain-containing protein [Epsilonproteobacteria bacterium]|nr:prepilin-type N-terminal cleavage/methylation domain-containing protein [Campylobacterota bacterium]